MTTREALRKEAELFLLDEISREKLLGLLVTVYNVAIREAAEEADSLGGRAHYNDLIALQIPEEAK
jgi:hypothetical protein